MKEYTLNRHLSKTGLKNTITLLAACLFWLAVWWVIAFIVNKEVILPSPVSVLRSLFALSITADFWKSVILSIARIIAGFLCGAAAAVLLAFTAHFSATVKTLLSPLVYSVRATPVASFIIIALVWITVGLIPPFIASLMVFPIVYDTTLTALNSSDKNLLEATRIFNWSRKKRIVDFYYPSVSKALHSCLTTSFGLAWKAGIAAEVLCVPKLSIGKHLYEAKLYLESSELLAWTAVVVLISILLERLVLKKASAKASQSAGKEQS